MEEQIKELQKQLTGDMMTDMDIRQKIHELQMKQNNVEPQACEIGCENCGS